MTSARTIITRALDELGVGQSGQALSADDASKCLSALNGLADAWLTAPNFSYTTNYVSAALGAGVQSLTIGPGLAFNCARPVRIESAFARVGNIDYEIRPVTEAEYLAIPLKDLNGPWPSVYYYDTGIPGLIYFYPTGSCTVTLSVQTQLSQFANLDTDYVLPPGYMRAFSLTLAEEVAPMFATQSGPMTMRNAKAARRDIKRANFVVPQLETSVRNDSHLPIVSNAGGIYDGVSDPG